MKTKLMKQRKLYQIEHSEFNVSHLNILPQIVGPMADSVQNIMGNYAPEPSAQFITTPRQGLQALLLPSLSQKDVVLLVPDAGCMIPYLLLMLYQELISSSSV